MRLFFAINFDEKVKDYLSEVQALVRSSALKGNYTLYDNFHLTLRFLGEFPESDVDIFCDCLDELATSAKPFKIKIGDIGSFNRKDKHIVYVDVLENKEDLYKLAKKLNEIIDNHIEVEDKPPFKPHITLGREVVFHNTLEPLNVLPYPYPILVDEVSLMLSSRNKHNVLTYKPLYTVKLGE